MNNERNDNIIIENDLSYREKKRWSLDRDLREKILISKGLFDSNLALVLILQFI